MMQSVRTEVEVSGPLPSPATLEGYDRVLPGAAERIMLLAERESSHRQSMDQQAIQADIQAQKAQLDLAKKQLSASQISDMLGQIFGLAISAGAISGSVYLAIQGHTAAAVALMSLPVAAIVQAFRGKASKKTEPNQKDKKG
jgi:uncharacterized membrane protein